MKNILLTASLLVGGTMLVAQDCTPFSTPCNASYYTVLGPQESSDLTTGDYIAPKASKLYKTNPTTGALTQIGQNDLGVHINALAYNPVDNFLYGMVDTTTFDRARFSFEQLSVVYRIGQEGCKQRMGTVIAPLNNPTAYTSGIVSFVGDMDKAGNYYFPAFVVNSLDLVGNTIDYDLYLGKIAGAELTGSKPGYLPEYTKIDRNTCTALFDQYVLAYCLAVIQGRPRPNTGLQDWAYNPDDNTLWGYIASDKKFFRLPLPDPTNPVALTAYCDDAPNTFPTLSSTELGGFFFDGNKNLYGLDPERGRYYALSNCADMSCGAVALRRAYSGDFEPITYPTFSNLRGDMAACALRTPITPTDEPFDCRTANLVVLAEQDKATQDAYTYPGKSQLYSVDVATGALTAVSGKPMGAYLEGLAISPITGFAYATSDSLRIESSEITQNVMMQRIDNAGFSRPLFEIKKPDLGALQNAIILTQAGEMDVDGNYYLPTVILNGTNSSAPYVRDYSFFIGVIPAAEFTAGNTTVQPNYRSVDLKAVCNNQFSRYIESMVAAVIENQKRPLTGLQDWAYDQPSNSLYSFWAAEKSLVVFDLTPATITANCIDAPPADNANASFTGQFFGADGKLYAFDTENGLYYDIKTCTEAAGCSAITALLSYSDAFSATKPDFKGLVGDAATCASRNTTLPVELAEFRATANKCEVSLRWITNSEKNNAQFEVEKSTNGINFVSVATIRGNGTTNLLHAYEYTDKTASKQNYYRLKQTDFDGTVNYPGATLAVNSNCNIRQNIGVAALYPNPTTANATLSFNASADEVGDATWIIADVAGRIVATGSQKLVLDNNLIPLDLQNLPNGVYVLRLQGDSWFSEAARLVKMKR
jgi:Secretion system C-terminal sorting domain